MQITVKIWPYDRAGREFTVTVVPRVGEEVAIGDSKYHVTKVTTNLDNGWITLLVSPPSLFPRM